MDLTSSLSSRAFAHCTAALALCAAPAMAQQAPTAPAAALAAAALAQPRAQPAARQGSAQGAPAEPEAIEISPEQVRAVERGLEWLAGHQSPNGSWSALLGYKLNDDYSGSPHGPSAHVGVTALAGMAFLAAGQHPGRGRYGPNIDRALDFVLSCSGADGYIARGDSRMYSHAFATLFLAEAYGTSWRSDVRAKLQQAVDFIVHSQNSEGGWRYESGAEDSDMSIVVCQVLALRAARNIGIHVPKSTVDRAARYVVDSAISDDDASESMRPFLPMGEYGAFRYQKGSASRSSFPLTAAGVTALNGLGIYSDDKIRAGLDYLQRGLDAFSYRYGNGSRERGHYFFWYGHYYGVQAMYTAGGRNWEIYYDKLRHTLLDMQEADGSFPNSVGPGPAFGTAMAVLVLQIPYRFLPIFQR